MFTLSVIKEFNFSRKLKLQLSYIRYDYIEKGTTAMENTAINIITRLFLVFVHNMKYYSYIGNVYLICYNGN